MGAQPKLRDIEKASISRQQTNDGRLAMLGRHDGDADVQIEPGGLEPRCAVLGQPPLRNVETRQDLDAGNQRLGQGVRRRGHSPQQSVHAHTHSQSIAHRFDVYVACSKLDCFFHKIVDRAYDRRAACKVAQAVDALLDSRGSQNGG